MENAEAAAPAGRKDTAMRCDRFVCLISVCLALLLLTGGCFRACASGGQEVSPVMSQYQERLDKIEPVMAAIERNKDHPCIYVTTLDRQTVKSKEEYVPAVINVFNCPEEMRLIAEGGIRVRGNSTADQGREKPYRIKFDRKQSMLGLNGGKAFKSWVLLRSFWHLASDYMAFQLARAIFEGKYYSSDCAFVNLYINGYAQGVYLLCEQNQAAKGRISVHEPEEGETGVEVGYLLEMDNYASDEHPYFTLAERGETVDITGQLRVLPARNYSIKSDLQSAEQEDYIRRYLEGVYTVLAEGACAGRVLTLDENLQPVPADGMYASPSEAAGALIDLESLANMVILEELTQNYDVGAGNFYLAVDFSKKSLYPKLTFLGPWDFNWGYTEDPKGGYYAVTFQKLMDDGWDRSNVWCILAMKLSGFQRIVRDKWARLSDSGILSDTVDQVMEECESLLSDLDKDAWKVPNARNIGNYVKERIAWLDGQWLER